MSVILPIREFIPHLRFETKVGEVAFVKALTALLDDCDLGYVPRPSTLKEFEMLSALVNDLKLFDDVDAEVEEDEVEEVEEAEEVEDEDEDEDEFEFDEDDDELDDLDEDDV